MALLPLTFTQMVALQAARAQAVASRVLDTRVGSVLRAFFEANAAVLSWLQVLLLQVRDRSRLATSAGADVDSFVGDFGLPRLPAIASGGFATFGRLSAIGSAVVPVGALARTATEGIQDFLVVADIENPAWDGTVNGGSGGYVLLQNTYEVTVPVRAVTAGAGGNVSAGTITLLGSAIPGIDTVTNALALTGGEDAETDESVKARFPRYIASLSKATRLAIEAAVASVQQGLTFGVQENVDPSGAFRPGHFVVVVDDGTGAPPAELLAGVRKAVEEVRALTVTYSVMPPAVLAADVSLAITVGPGGSKAALAALVSTAVTAFLRALPVGAPLPFSRIAAIAYAVDPSITNVSSVAVNGGAADLVPGPMQVVKPRIVAVS